VRVLFSSTVGWGHINPMIPLARAFLERGDEVLWATPAEAVARLEAEGFAVRTAGRIGESVPEILRRSPELQALPAEEGPDLMFAKIFGGARVAAALEDLVPIVRSWSPTLVVRDAAEFAAPIAAAAHGLPSVTHAFGALLPARRVARIDDDVAPLWEAHGLQPRPFGGSYDHLYLDIYPPSLQPQERPHVPATLHVRPSPPGSAPPEALPEVLAQDSTRPLVYATFGTVFNDAGPLGAVVRGARELDVRLLVTVGPEGDPEALGPQPEHVHVARYIPQEHLLPHCAAVVSHAGSGTFLAAATAGLPQLCLPQGADQYLNAAACKRSGIGISLGAPSSAADVQLALEQLLAESSFAAAALAVSRDIAAMPSTQDAADRLHDDYG
jgi:UDP:flavonoid glycosyltransferase YjiC (YdhE family)